jgi:hypothetical protein
MLAMKLYPSNDLNSKRHIMRGKLLTAAVLTLVLSFVFPSSGLQASESIRVYMGFSREVNEALAKKIDQKPSETISQGFL